MSTDKPIVGATMGDPAGIGSEIIVDAYPSVVEDLRLVVLGDADVMRKAVESCDSDLEIRAIDDVSEAAYENGVLDVLDFDNVPDHIWGEVRAEFGAASLEYVELAIDLAKDGDIDAMCNAPINKEALNKAGSEYAGHTKLLADRTDTDEYAMLLMHEGMRVTHVTVHMSLQEAIDTITTERVLDTIEVTEAGLEDIGIEEPSVGVAGLNPHAGEGGVLGHEDEEIIEPAVEAAQEAGIDATGPLPGDSIFTQAAAGRFDGTVAMYHDQGHIPVYVHAMLPNGSSAGVNMTIGIPIIRTSTIHGTAFDIAGEGIAAGDNFVNALQSAARAAARKASQSS
jgi:4-hydroxythreonine-4-phosphate dehydrogenase